MKAHREFLFVLVSFARGHVDLGRMVRHVGVNAAVLPRIFLIPLPAGILRNAESRVIEDDEESATWFQDAGTFGESARKILNILNGKNDGYGVG